MIHSVTLNPSLDYYVKVDDILLGRKNNVEFKGLVPGGKGFNVANVLDNLSVPVKTYGILGGNVGNLFGLYLQNKRYEKELFWLNNQTETRLNVKVLGNKDTEFNTSGPFVDEKILDSLILKLRSNVKENDMVILSGSLPQGLSADSYKKIISNLPNNLDIIVDAQGKELLNSLRYRPLLVKPNYYELCSICNKKLNTLNDLFNGMNYLLVLGAKNVILSLGEQGALLMTSNREIYHAQAKFAKARNTVGAGDCLVAGFAFVFSKTRDVLSSFKIGVASASAYVYLNKLPTAIDIANIGNTLKFERIK